MSDVDWRAQYEQARVELGQTERALEATGRELAATQAELQAARKELADIRAPFTESESETIADRPLLDRVALYRSWAVAEKHPSLARLLDELVAERELLARLRRPLTVFGVWAEGSEDPIPGHICVTADGDDVPELMLDALPLLEQTVERAERLCPVHTGVPLEAALSRIPEHYELTAARYGVLQAGASIRHIGFAGKIYDGEGSSLEEAITSAVQVYLDARGESLPEYFLPGSSLEEMLEQIPPGVKLQLDQRFGGSYAARWTTDLQCGTWVSGPSRAAALRAALAAYGEANKV